MSASTEPRFAAVVVDALAGPADEELRARLGPEIHDAIRALLRDHALAWATEAGGTALQARAAGELGALLADHEGPVLLAAPDVPGLGPHHVAAARDDLAAGVTLAFAPATDGRPFLLALASPDPEILALAGQPFDDLAAVAARAGGSFGMLRPERRLASLADARALRADPLCPPALRALLPAGL